MIAIGLRRTAGGALYLVFGMLCPLQEAKPYAQGQVVDALTGIFAHCEIVARRHRRR